MSALEYRSNNLLVAYPFKDGCGYSEFLPKDCFLDILFRSYDPDIARVYLSELTKSVGGNVTLQFKNCEGDEVLGEIVIPSNAVVNHLLDTESCFAAVADTGEFSVKLVLGDFLLNASPFNSTFSSSQSELSSGAIILSQPVVSSLTFERYNGTDVETAHVYSYVDEDKPWLTFGTNTVLQLDNGEIAVDVGAGLGKGKYNPCPSEYTEINSINSISPNTDGNFYIMFDQCYSVDMATEASVVLFGDKLNDYTYTIPGFIMQNACEAKCPPEQMNAVAYYTNRVTDALKDLSLYITNPVQTGGYCSGSGKIVTATFFSSENPPPSEWLSSTSYTTKFSKLFHEGHVMRIMFSPGDVKTYTIKKVIDDTSVELDRIPEPNKTTTSWIFKVDDLGVYNLLSSAIQKYNIKAQEINVPYAEMNYSTVEQYNEDQQYGTFITAAAGVFNPTDETVNFSFHVHTSGQASLSNNTLKVRKGDQVLFNTLTFSLTCKQYAFVECVAFIPCGGLMGGLSFDIKNASTNTSVIGNDTLHAYTTSTSCGTETLTTYADSYKDTAFKQYIPFNDGIYTTMTVIGALPSWLSLHSETSTNESGQTNKAYYVSGTNTLASDRTYLASFQLSNPLTGEYGTTNLIITHHGIKPTT